MSDCTAGHQAGDSTLAYLESDNAVTVIKNTGDGPGQCVLLRFDTAFRHKKSTQPTARRFFYWWS